MLTTHTWPTGPLVDVPRFSLAGVQDHQHLLLWQARGRTQFVIDGSTTTLTA